ncbi:MAG: helix-turn-helix domain-containing protein [Dehalococcoidia bacterium]|jgi:excisionase family DNA binding protein
MLTTSDVARLLNVHINTVRRWSNQGTLKTYRIGARGDRRFRREDIASFLSPETEAAGGNGNNTPNEKSSPVNGNKVLANY